MTEDRYVDGRDPLAARDRLGEIFERALAIPAAERARFLEAACREDPALRDEVDSLLASHTAAPDFLDSLAARVLPAALLAWSEPAPAGAILGRYQVLERLGSGGMGIVYKARDLSLDRPVALKFLPPHLAADPEARARLHSEARAASALDHPSIAVVHEIGSIDPSDDDGFGPGLFIVMAYYEGETLREVIRRGPLPVDEALRYAIQLADGLARAHEAGIVHRDIKPGNVIVTPKGQVRIVDFGVAKVTGASPGGEGGRIGTVPYMSPEQTRGGDVDHRTDLWSLGVVLHEMLAGTRPFAGETDEAIIGAIRRGDPPALRELRAEIPPEVERIVRRCLAADPAGRYGHAESLLEDLRAAAGTASGSIAAAPAERDGILVLPFANISRDPRDEYFSDGLTEEVIATLAHLRALRVISRTSAMRLKGSARDVREIADELGVRHVLEGSVRKAGDAVRITARLIDARTDDPLWTHQFDGTLDDVFRVQEQVGRAVAEALRIRLTTEESRALEERPIPDARAYECYLRARYEAWRFSRDGLERATHYLETALSIVGDNALLLSTLGHVTAMYLEAGLATGAEPLDRLSGLAEDVFALDPDSPRGHWLKAFVAFQRADLRGAITWGERARVLEPDDPDTLILLGYVYAHAGRNSEARRFVEDAARMDPLTPLTQCMPGFVALMEGRYADAVEAYRRQYRMDPDSPFAAVTLGWVLAYDRREEAIPVLDDAAARFADTAFGSWARALALALRGDPEGCVRAISPALEGAAARSEMFARGLTGCYALAGEAERALDWLERTVELGLLNYPFLAEHDRLLDGVRDTARFETLLERVRVAAEELATV